MQAVLRVGRNDGETVAEAAADMRGSFTAPEVAATIGERQVQSNLRVSGHVQVKREGTHSRACEYDDVEDPALAAVELPDVGRSSDDRINGETGLRNL